MHTGITVCISLEIKYNGNTTLSLGYHFTTHVITQSQSHSILVILAALAVPVAARAANPASLLACTTVSAAVTLAVALDHSLTSNRRYEMSSFSFSNFW